MDDCPATEPCAPGGHCVDGTNTYECECDFGYSGNGTKSCVNVDDCATKNDCSPGGVCVDEIGKYSCKCDGDTFADEPGNSCRFTFRRGGIYDAVNNLVWESGYTPAPKNGDPPAYQCSSRGTGSHPATVAQINTIVGRKIFDCGTLCFATTTVDVCGPGSIDGQATHCVWCLLP